MPDSTKKEILLESGTNELEVMEFTIDGQHFGINVAKVVSIMAYPTVTPMPNANPFVEGIFKPRDEIMTVINLAAYMGLPPSKNQERDIIIITKFNNMVSAFHVHSIEAIHRISWTNIEKPDPTIYGGTEGLATGIARVDGNLITIVDFEKILVSINPEAGFTMESVNRLGERGKNYSPILIAEDSQLLEHMLMDALKKAGYVNLICCNNGKEAWDKLQEIKRSGIPINDQVSCVITDIEMPQLDGHHLLKLIREDSHLNHLPVIVFSSLITDELRHKGESLGATAQISKTEIENLIHYIDAHLMHV